MTTILTAAEVEDLREGAEQQHAMPEIGEPPEVEVPLLLVLVVGGAVGQLRPVVGELATMTTTMRKTVRV
jgi:hypothetical protein